MAVECYTTEEKYLAQISFSKILHRMAVEFYMTEGKYLAIGRLACSGCKVKGLKV